jgi:hypothetical protein
LADAYDAYRLPCNSSELSAIGTAINNAKKLASAASNALPTKDSTGGARFQKWFGGPEGDDDPRIKQVYDEMGVNLIFQKFWCLPPSSVTPEKWAHTNAFILRGSVGEIFILSNFFSLPATGPKSQGGTIVHEVSHQSSVMSVKDDDIDGDGVNDYGPANAKTRASQSAAMARSNADNFKYFAEDTLYGVP